MKLFGFVSAVLGVFFLAYLTWDYSPTREDLGIATLVWFGTSVLILLFPALAISTDPPRERTWNSETKEYEYTPKSWKPLHTCAHACLAGLIPLFLFFGFLYAKQNVEFDVPSIDVQRTEATPTVQSGYTFVGDKTYYNGVEMCDDGPYEHMNGARKLAPC